MNQLTAKRRMQEINDELDAALKNKSAITDEWVDERIAEYQQCEDALKGYSKALSYRSNAAHDDSAAAPDQPADKGLIQKRWDPPSPLDASQEQWEQLYHAAKSGLNGFRVNIGEPKDKSLDAGDLTHKAPLGEGTPGSLIPSILLPDYQAFQLRYEPERLFSLFPGFAAGEASTPTGQSVEFLQHQGNTNPAAAVAELATKPDLGMQVAPITVPFTVIACTATFSRQILSDFQSFMTFAPAETQRAVINAETDQIINGSGAAPNMLGLMNQTGVLTRAVGADTEIDALTKAVNDIRVGTSFGFADLIVMNPTTWLNVKLHKTTFNSYVLSANDPGPIGALDNLFGVRVVTNTKVPANVAIVMDSQIAVRAFVRWGLEVQMNQFGDTVFATNAIQFRCEERIAYGLIRPTAVCVVTGLVAGGS